VDLIDQTTIERDGITYRVIVAYDPVCRPDDYDCYSDDAKAAWSRDDWCYTGVIVRPVIAGSEVKDAEDSLWGVEYGTLPGHVSTGPGDDEPTHDPICIGIDQIVNDHPVPDMIGTVRGNLARLRDGELPAERQARELRAALTGLSLENCTAYNPGEKRGSNIANAYCLRAAGHDPKHRDLNGREW
jgi:hypothetical protein